jgi:hypothetical protein
MKTPREILLARHREAEPQLDSIRRNVIAAFGKSSKRGSFPVHVLKSCRDLLRMPRLAWTGLAAAWMVIIALHLASSETAPAQTHAAQRTAKRSPEMLQALREQRRLFAELVGFGSAPEAEAPRFVPRPRSECLPATIAA